MIGLDLAAAEDRVLGAVAEGMDVITPAVFPEPRPLTDYLSELPGGHERWSDRKVLKQEGEVVLLTRRHCDYVVAFDREGTARQRRRYFNFPTKNRTEKEARAAAEKEFGRRTSC